ncbi:MAG: hypothetical protein V4610_07680 [Pseudomonadota bacterium]|jgi:hypothetical protein|uniref:HNH endonuclease 5 domain-containing protein n=1 Tax=hydrothermal vent metagenome TaxID=652676 RepID=A0A160TGV6_9ZZZZ
MSGALPDVRFPPVGRCIYCGATSARPGGKGRLTEEHIIPFALDGHMILPEASCDSCQKITSGFETAVLRGGYRPIREWLGMSSRTKGRPKTLPMFVDTDGGGSRKVDVPVDIYPVSLLVPVQPVPTLLRDRFGPSPAANPPIWARMIAGDSAALEAMGLPAAASQMLDAHACFRMVAKIAHSMAVAAFGFGSFEPLLLDCILRGWDDAQEAFIGSLPGIERPRMAMHRVDLSPPGWSAGEGDMLIAKVRLFARYGAPTFLVVVGRRPPSG